MTSASFGKEHSNATGLPVTFILRDGSACVLRPMTEDDAEELCTLLPQMHRESDFLHYLPGEFDKTVEQEKEFIREYNDKPCSILMVAQVEGRIAGIAGATSPEFKRLAHHAECGLTVLKEFWSQRIGRKMMECIIEWAQERGLRKLYLRVFSGNQRAIQLYQSLGFVEEGLLKAYVLRGDGTYDDTIIMARCRANED